VRIVVLSDTHGMHGIDVPDGDVLVHAGDLTMRGTLGQIRLAVDFLRSQPHRHKLVVAGNHDFAFEREPAAARALVRGLTYLEGAGTEIDGVSFWGGPWQPWFHDWAFNLERGAELAAKWALIPEGTEVVITHGPPHGVLDRVGHEDVGCEALAERIEALRPGLHCFGHIHEGHGFERKHGTLFANACICTRGYAPTNPALVVDRTADGGWAAVTNGHEG
jgi:Icc-related predicted phosphoesterase